MPRGIYPRKKKPEALKRSGGGDKVAELLTVLRAERTKAEDRVVALGTAIDALEALAER